MPGNEAKTTLAIKSLSTKITWLTTHSYLCTLIQCHSPTQTTCQEGNSTSCTKWASFLLLVTHTTTSAPTAARLGIGRPSSWSEESHLYLCYEVCVSLSGKDTGSNQQNNRRCSTCLHCLVDAVNELVKEDNTFLFNLLLSSDR